MTELLLEWNNQLTKQRDEHGNTPLHFSLSQEGEKHGMLPLYAKRYSVVAHACQTPALSGILNKQDNEGNTALHLAVEAGDWWIFACLFVNKQVDLNLPNSSGHTPLELSINTIPTGLYCLLNLRILIQETLIAANATRGISRMDAAADDHANGGTPTLARAKQFQGFVMANTLAFFCSSLAVLSLVFAGTPTAELPMRYTHYNISIWLSLNAVGSLAIAFAIAVYIMITPVAAKTSPAVIVVILSSINQAIKLALTLFLISIKHKLLQVRDNKKKCLHIYGMQATQKKALSFKRIWTIKSCSM
uniref:PGG domain-containing protein n=1 Tax=Oryza meridionalis TaxID=40149 RepID=A0A0E0EYM9_9ORYZ